MIPFRSLPPALLFAGLCACNQAVDPEREYTRMLDQPKVVDGNPNEVPPENRVDVQFTWLQALDRSDVGDAVAPGIESELFGGVQALALEDLYVELWHDGGSHAQRLLDGVRDCDANAVIHFGRPLLVAASELEPPSDWPCELRYLESDPRGRAAAELLRDHLRDGCTGPARAAVRSIVEQHGLVLRPVAELQYAGNPGNLSPLVLLATTPRPVVVEGQASQPLR
jgi:hypothetical protein